MFNSCTSLSSVPLFTTNAVTTMSSMFNSCHSLKSVPLFTTNAVTTMASMFLNCYSLKSVPLFTTNAVTNMSSMFEDCISLKSVPLFNTSSVTTMETMFLNCYSLESIPSFNMSSMTGTGMSGFVANTINLTSLTVNAPAITSITQLLLNPSSTVTMPNGGSPLNNSNSSRAIKNISINCSGITSPLSSSLTVPFGPLSSTTFPNVTSLILTGLRYSITPASSPLGLRLDGIALDALYTSLGTAVGAQTFIVTANHGTVDDTPSIATAKGWTITGS
jgi:surface protein